MVPLFKRNLPLCLPFLGGLPFFFFLSRRIFWACFFPLGSAAKSVYSSPLSTFHGFALLENWFFLEKNRIFSPKNFVKIRTVAFLPNHLFLISFASSHLWILSILKNINWLSARLKIKVTSDQTIPADSGSSQK